jgi:hypothetical protein
MSRWKAAAIHFGLSVVIVSTVLLGLIALWYPPELWRMAKVGGLVLILASVDVTLGPLLTLAVFKQGKRGMKFDLAVIALLQILGLAYGLHIMFQSRPVFLVAVPDRFELVFANEIEADDLKLGAKGFDTLGWFAPKRVGARIPTDPEERNKRMLEVMEGKRLERSPKYFVPYDTVAGEMLGRARQIKKAPTTAFDREVLSIVNERGLSPDSVVYHDIACTRGWAGLLLDAKTGAIVGPINVDPLQSDGSQ